MALVGEIINQTPKTKLRVTVLQERGHALVHRRLLLLQNVFGRSQGEKLQREVGFIQVGLTGAAGFAFVTFDFLLSSIYYYYHQSQTACASTLRPSSPTYV